MQRDGRVYGDLSYEILGVAQGADPSEPIKSAFAAPQTRAVSTPSLLVGADAEDRFKEIRARSMYEAYEVQFR